MQNTTTDKPTVAALNNELAELEMALALAEDLEETSRARKLRTQIKRITKQPVAESTKRRKLVAGGRVTRRLRLLIASRAEATAGCCMLPTAWGPCRGSFGHASNHVCGGRHA